MKTIVFILSFVALGLGCEKETAPPRAGLPPASPTATNSQSSSSVAAAASEGRQGPEREMGNLQVAGYQVRVVRLNEIAPGTEADIDVYVSGGAEPPSAVRLWVGTPEGKGALKANAGLSSGKGHAHVEVPNPIPDGALMCVELEVKPGEKAVGTLQLSQK